MVEQQFGTIKIGCWTRLQPNGIAEEVLAYPKDKSHFKEHAVSKNADRSFRESASLAGTVTAAINRGRHGLQYTKSVG